MHRRVQQHAQQCCSWATGMVSIYLELIEVTNYLTFLHTSWHFDIHPDVSITEAVISIFRKVMSLEFGCRKETERLHKYVLNVAPQENPKIQTATFKEIPSVQGYFTWFFTCRIHRFSKVTQKWDIFDGKFVKKNIREDLQKVWDEIHSGFSPLYSRFRLMSDHTH